MKRLIWILLLVAPLCQAQLGTTTQIRHGATLPTTCVGGDIFIKSGSSAGFYFNIASGTCSWVGPAAVALADPGSNGIIKRTALNTTAVAAYTDVVGLWTTCTGYLKNDGTCDVPSGTAQVHTITIPIAGAPIATGTGSVGTPSAPTTFSCTINSAKIVGGTSGSITVDIWKAAGSVPSSGDKISASAPVTLSSAQVNTSSSLSGWTTSVSSNDIFWASVASADGVMATATVQLGCQ